MKLTCTPLLTITTMLALAACGSSDAKLASGPTGSPDAGPPPPCEATKSDALVAQLKEVGFDCATVVRVDPMSVELLAYRIFCGPHATIDETAALTEAKNVTEIAPGAQSVSGHAPKDEFHFTLFFDGADFWQQSLVSARNGLALFSSISWAPSGGSIKYPQAWNAAADLGGRCAPRTHAAPPPARGYGGESFLDVALGAVWTSVLPDALEAKGQVLDAYVFSALTGTDPSSPQGSKAEWIVIVNSVVR